MLPWVIGVAAVVVVGGVVIKAVKNRNK